MSHWPTDGREVELVICNPEGKFWNGSNFVEEYPDALTWGGDEPSEAFWDDDLGAVDEDAYQDYLDEEFNKAEAELLNNKEIPVDSYIEMGVGYAQKRLITKERGS